jgi:signal transduction histidine kinase
MSENAGIALLCDLDGNITQMLYDQPGVGAALQTGSPFARLAAPGNLAKALSFLDELRSHGEVLGWEINVDRNGLITTLYFNGYYAGAGLLIVGAENGSQAIRLYEGLRRMVYGPDPSPNSAAREKHRLEFNENLYEEISRLNNELVSIQRELAKKNAELEFLNKLKNQFIGMAAHDLRSPLQAALLLSSFVRDEYPKMNPAELVRMLNEIHRVCQNMINIVNDMLSVSLIEAGLLNLDLQPVDLAALTLNIIQRNRMLAAPKQIEISLQAEALPQMGLDPGKIEQVLDNLLQNAIKFSQPFTEIAVYLCRQGDAAILIVQDHGPGIPANETENLFLPFSRTSARATAGESSTGLGLVIVKRIVEGHGGKIWLESEVGRGTTFFVSLPLKL